MNDHRIIRHLIRELRRSRLASQHLQQEREHDATTISLLHDRLHCNTNRAKRQHWELQDELDQQRSHAYHDRIDRERAFDDLRRAAQAADDYTVNRALDRLGRHL